MKNFMLIFLKHAVAFLFAAILTTFLVLIILLLCVSLNLHISDFLVGYLYASILYVYTWRVSYNMFFGTDVNTEVSSDEPK